MNKNNFGTQLQLLVDGELDHAGRSKFLASLGRESEGWKKIALAFVERQILDESFQPTSRYSRQNNGGLIAAPAIEAHAGTALEVAGARDVTLRKSIQLSPRRLQTSWWVATSACLLIGLVLGIWSAGSPSSSRATTDNSINKNSDVLPVITHADLTRTMPLSEALERSPVPVPIVFRRELMKQGYLVNELARLTKVQLPTGETIEMPIRQVDIRYLGTATFQ